MAINDEVFDTTPEDFTDVLIERNSELYAKMEEIPEEHYLIISEFLATTAAEGAQFLLDSNIVATEFQKGRIQGVKDAADMLIGA